jgi:uncharacterized protein
VPDNPEFLVMAKAVGARCNLRCAYCYYLDKAGLLPAAPPVMSGELLERYVRERLAAAPVGATVHFEWHGGEPLLAGLDFFRTAVSLQRKYARAGQRVTNGVQTNGLLVDDEWASFLGEAGFSVGLSIDGPARFHDAVRRTPADGPSHEAAVRAFQLLKTRRAFVNVLCVISGANVGAPAEVYDFFRGLGATYLQFLPLVTHLGGGRVSPLTPASEAVGEFLIRVFDRWIAGDVGRIVIQTFDEALRPLFGAEHSLCVHRPTCGNVLVLEREGSVFSCDHFVDAGHRLGSLADRPLSKLAGLPEQVRFGAAKRDALPAACRVCDMLVFCNGGCPKDRFVDQGDGQGKLNYLCPSYRNFFRHCRPELERLAAHMKAGRKLREFRPLSAT